MNKTSIEWCNRPETRGPAGAMTWNPVRARLKGASPKARSGTFCTRISPGCTHCYASTINKRFGNGLEFTVPNLEQIEFFIDERILEQPRKQKKACTIFVADMFDLFHEAISDADLSYVFATMMDAPQHTFQLLTKRAVRMHDFVGKWCNTAEPNIWLGVSVESQQYANERIPLLLQTPAAVRFLSVEPMLEAVNLRKLDWTEETWLDCLTGIHGYNGSAYHANRCLDSMISWVICGGESGPGARPFNLAWAESLLTQCRAAGVPFFFKQMGTRPYASKESPSFSYNTLVFRDMRKDRMKGGNPEDWPESLRVREFPSQKAEVVSA